MLDSPPNHTETHRKGFFRDCSKLTDVLLTHRRDAEGAESFQDFLRVLRASAVKVSRVSVAMLHCPFFCEILCVSVAKNKESDIGKVITRPSPTKTTPSGKVGRCRLFNVAHAVVATTICRRYRQAKSPRRCWEELGANRVPDAP
jgi:hypothetical protein